MTGFDLFLRREDGDERRVTDRGLAQGFDVQGDLVAWTERKHPRGNPVVITNPHSVWMAQLDGAGGWDEEQVYQGWNQGNVAVGAAGFAAFWSDRYRVRLVWPGLDEPVRIPGPSASVPARLDADGDLLVYGTDLPDGGTRVHVLRVTPPN